MIQRRNPKAGIGSSHVSFAKAAYLFVRMYVGGHLATVTLEVSTHTRLAGSPHNRPFRIKGGSCPVQMVFPRTGPLGGNHDFPQANLGGQGVGTGEVGNTHLVVRNN